VDERQLPAALAPLRFLLGTWVGEGRGEYPTVEDFRYAEETTFAVPGKPVLAYSQRTWTIPDRRASHAELGYLRPVEGGAELLLVQPSGVAEVSVGTVAGTRLELATIALARTPTAKSITDVRRTYERRGDTLWYRLDMAAVDQPLGIHCEAELRLA
jgi:THAP4-like, heme-binding beta-barrel domain